MKFSHSGTSLHRHKQFQADLAERSVANGMGASKETLLREQLLRTENTMMRSMTITPRGIPRPRPRLISYLVVWLC